MSTTTRSGPVATSQPAALDLFLIEDDAGDAFLFEELLRGSGLAARIIWVRSLAEARRRLSDAQCVIVDLSLPDAAGLEALREVLALMPHAAVLVLTGLKDAHVGVAAVAAGAQDYLVKQDVDGQLLARAIRYAIERKRADESQRRLVEAELRSQENARLERGLLPVPLIDDAALVYESRYRPGRQQALLGGDFYDTVQTGDGSVHMVIGDVCGHGPDEAALGVCLRIAWRTLVLAGRTGQDLLGTLDQVLCHERKLDEIFTTLCMMTIDQSRRAARFHLAGHPPPLVISAADEVAALPDGSLGPALGLLPGAEWPAGDLVLGDEWSLLLYTDGLIEGFAGDGGDRLGTDGLIGLVRQLARGAPADTMLTELVNRVEELNGGPLVDDLAILLLSGRASR